MMLLKNACEINCQRYTIKYFIYIDMPINDNSFVSPYIEANIKVRNRV